MSAYTSCVIIKKELYNNPKLEHNFRPLKEFAESYLQSAHRHCRDHLERCNILLLRLKPSRILTKSRYFLLVTITEKKPISERKRGDFHFEYKTRYRILANF